MKTEHEIKERLDKITTNSHLMTNDDKKTIPTLVNALVWVLDDSKVLGGGSKRTIFDLTKEELLELFYTAMPSLREANLDFYNYQISKERDFVGFIMLYDDNDCWNIRIYSNLSMYLHFEGERTIENQADYIDRIREMLSKPTQLLSNPKQLEGENEMV